ncbi:GumC family protein [Segetibacter aerophilus]|uniref:non-specific protein-tyrosine kinase n=1 Tax=Segetibacter aerophilus TaxID=670293 RepID=A0A512BGZ2_9BACT|nr:polysaccharide biosynthesis tyrosine autokinase [Segetibacter aerophilus]GEO11233.1 tyrosine protein kinase [Segetibacter aerophilus]
MNSNYKTETNESLIAQVSSKFFPYWPVFLILLTISLAAAYVYLQIVTPVYLSSATILIKDEKKGAEESKMTENFNYFSSKKIVENEIEVIHSRAVLTEVIKKLFLLAPTFEKKKFKYISAYVTSPVTIDVRNILPTKDLEKDNKIPFSYLSKTKQVKILDSTYKLNDWVKTPYGTLKFLENKGQTSIHTDALFFSLIDVNKAVATLSSSISVTPVSKLSTVVRLNIEDEVPQRGNDILNAVANTYYTFSIRDKNEMAENTLHFLQERIEIVERDLDSLERRIQMFKSGQGIVDLSVQGQQYIQNVGSNNQKIADINMQLAVLSQLEKYVVAKDNTTGIIPSSLGVTDPGLTKLLDKLYSAETEYEKLKRLTGENNPILLSMQAQIQQLRPGILENIRNQRRSLQAGKLNINTTNSSYSNVLGAIPQKEKGLLELTRQQGIISSVYTFLLQKREEAGLSFSSNIADNKIIDTAAASISPVKPSKVYIYLVALAIALSLGICVVVGKDQLNGSILYRSEIEKLTAFPIIGEIAFKKSKSSLVILDGQRGLVAEQFRKLRASLSSTSNGKIKKILITSTIAGEGKSFITANLGLALALAGKRVVLLELDLINPSLSDKLLVQEEKGIAAFLLGEINLEDIIRSTEESPNLYIIPAGQLPDNPSELIMNGNIKKALTLLEERFDYIIIDTAPISALSDAYILSPLADTTFFIVRHNHTPKAGFQRFDENNKANELKNLRIIFNGVRHRGFTKSSYGYEFEYLNNSKPRKMKLISQKSTWS